MKIAEALENKILEYAQEFNQELASIEPLKIEASGRKYFRVNSKNLSYVISFDDRPINGQNVFINRANELAASNVRVPKIFKHDTANFLTILEDLGAVSYTHLRAHET